MASLKYQNVVVTLNAMAKVPQIVPVHEVAVLQELYGDAGVAAGAMQTVETDVPDAAIEYGRLCGKYGADAVGKVYRSHRDGAFAEALKKAQG